MEQENMQKEKNPTSNGAGNHNRRNHHRGGRRGRGGRGSEHTARQGKTEDAVQATRSLAPAREQTARAESEGVGEPKENRSRESGQGGGQRKSGRSRGRGRGGNSDREAVVRETEVASEKPLQEYKLAPSVTTAPLFRSQGDRWLDDTFSPLHEVEIHDPAAEQAARERLDAEGPLLFAQERAAKATENVSEETVETVEIVGVCFKHPGKVYYFAPGDLQLKSGDHAIVETTRGPEYGEVAFGNRRMDVRATVQPLRAVIRVATEADTKHHEENRSREDEAFRLCREKIAEHKLDMKLVEAQYTFDNSKLLFYFTSDGRVDFRELVKDLASLFRTRIELRQIGIRDEAKLLGGLGACGRTLCCAGFLPDFVQVSIKMAKEQNLSLNSTKISGACGRLMCCLRYEYETYEAEIRMTPPVDSVVETHDGRGTVVANHPLKGTVTVRLFDHTDEQPRLYHRDEVKVLRGRGERSTDATEREEELSVAESEDVSATNPGEPRRTNRAGGRGLARSRGAASGKETTAVSEDKTERIRESATEN